MRMRSCAAIVFGLAFVVANPCRADDNTTARALLEKAIQAQGGEAELVKTQASTVKLKGTIHMQGMAIAFTGEVVSQGADQQRLVVDVEVDNQKFRVVRVLNRDKGWEKFNDDLTEMDKEKLAEAKDEAYAGWVGTLVPLRDKTFTLATVGETKVEGRPAAGLRVSRKGNRDITLYFDQKTHLLVKTETRVKDEGSGQEVTEETVLSAHAEKGARQAMKLTTQRDGKPFLEAEVVEFKVEEKLDDSVFAKP